MRRQQPGRLRIRAAQILCDTIGYAVDPEDIKVALGYWRIADDADCYRWEVFGHNGSWPVVLGCWSTLTDFVRLATKYGYVIDSENCISPLVSETESLKWKSGKELDGPHGYLNANCDYYGPPLPPIKHRDKPC